METLKTILYFSIFRYPLRIEEIHSYTNYESITDTEKELQHLIAEKILIKVDDFYVYGSDLDSVIKRLRGNMYAGRALRIAQKKARFIAKFPFVKAVGVSGSLSKGYYDNGSDIDFFVITEPNKLWLCRTFLMLYKKIFLLNSRKYFCVNYFVSTSQLEIEEKNRFTATEMKTLIPMQGKKVFEEFYQKNLWVNDYFNKFSPNLSSVPNFRKSFVTQSIEFVFGNPIGNLVDNSFKMLTLKKWKTKFHTMSEEDFKIALKSTKNISKHHPSHFQKKVILDLNNRIEEVSHNFNINLAKEHV
ncbi:nucleotidyltransferase domain-containing protein [Flavobacterium sp. J49]|uniref:nucleotidyltransferase domain-containing protein n=1 Tax=Flavobacterium sp. J49 TaxID=2718534 RepID=UPI001593C855|nr:nucleotidyltransferase domain-containing protein [Flavobacterium sp. J49]MBF6641190.1 nucleotidyltransferase domain-containing protein [Flavobacterium sp. J49]NIC02437.1 nucleotidyltransferase domain-containing protein [Flavobacterium sp. J49]